ncbi:hypothetical protein MJO29_008030 [Puccinia striiformis f. sp. tritici]|nr:hypothetical protein MJO29_008030 [Puccinia striiformis f. sp. tritici]
MFVRQMIKGRKSYTNSAVKLNHKTIIEAYIPNPRAHQNYQWLIHTVTVFDAEESSRTVPADNLAFQVQFISTSVLIRDFSQNLQSNPGARQPPLGSVRGNVYDPDAELQQRIASSP